MRKMGVLFSAAMMLLLSVSQISAQESVSEPVELLLNGGFEQAFVVIDGNDDVRVAMEWSSFSIESSLDITSGTGAKPNYNVVTNVSGRVYEGDQSQSIEYISETSSFSGVYQHVDVTPGTTVRLSANTYAWSSDSDDVDYSSNASWIRQRIGIDPFGGTDPLADSVVWTNPAQFVDTWGELSLETVIESGKATIYLSAYPDSGNLNNKIYYDNASLVAVALPLPQAGDVTVVVNKTVVTTVSCEEILLSGLVSGCGDAPGSQGYRGNVTVATQQGGANSVGTPMIFVFVLFMIAVIRHGYQKRNKVSR